MAKAAFSEDTLQKWCVEYARRVHPRLVVFAVPNGGKRGKIEAKRLKAMGVLAGVSDLIIVACGLVVFCELKVGDNDQQQSQRDFQREVEARRHRYELCYTQEVFMALCKELDLGYR